MKTNFLSVTRFDVKLDVTMPASSVFLKCNCLMACFILRRGAFFVTLAAAFLLTFNGAGQVLMWTKQIEASLVHQTAGVATGVSGDIYVAGSFLENACFGTQCVTNVGGSGLFLAKYDPNGNLIWVRTAEGEFVVHGADVATDTSGNIYVTGSFQGWVNFGGTNLAAISTDLFVCKYDPSGTLIWVRQGDQGSGTGIAADPNGNTVVTGSLGDAVAIIEKRDAAGNLLWQRALDASSSYHQGENVKIDSDGAVYATGYFGGRMELGATTLTSHGASDAFLVKLDSNGTFLWARQAGGVAHDYSAVLALDPSGNPIIAGHFRRVAIFGQTNLSTRFPTVDEITAGFVANMVATELCTGRGTSTGSHTARFPVWPLIARAASG